MKATTDKSPHVSILIRSMDRPSLQAAVESAAKQTWPNLDIVVLAACGRSHRALPDVVLGRSLRLILPDPDRRLSRPNAANACLEAARGEWLNFLDDDDELLPQHVVTLVQAPREAHERVVFSVARTRDARGKVVGHVGHAGNHTQLYFHSRATPCATLFHRSLVDEGARFDPEFSVLEDHDFFVNCAARTAFLFVDAATCIWSSQSGTSGCGAGTNVDTARRKEALDRIRRKWSAFFQRWLSDADALLSAGEQYLKSRDFSRACECLERALALRPYDVVGLSLCGMANYHSGNTERADRLVTQALQHWPQHPALQESLGLIRSTRSRTW